MNELTFNGIKDSLIEYYSSKDEFKDFNWTAPAISTLIDAQAYLAYWMTTYANFALNESFLDTAQKRSSVVSKAMNIGYFPKQYSASRAKVKIIYSGTQNLDDLTIIPSGTVFIAQKDGSTYYFRTKQAFPVIKNEIGKYSAELDIHEGTPHTDKWIQYGNKNTAFILSNDHVDADSIVVTVYKNSSDKIGKLYERLSDINQFSPDAALYSLEETPSGKLALIFGDDILAKSISVGSIVECSYNIVSGEEANDIAVFELNEIPGLTSQYAYWETNTIEISNNGTDRESIESIRRNAPRFFQRQGRNVVAEDYKADILSKYGDYIESISVWGGEDSTPPDFGSVIISIKPKNVQKLTRIQKEEIINAIKGKSVVGITPKIIDPNIIYINFDINVQYNRMYSRYNENKLRKIIADQITKYFNDSLTAFNVNFVYSKFISSIFDIEDSINDIECSIIISQYILPKYNVKASYIVDFKNELIPGSIKSEPFNVFSRSNLYYYISDDGNGKLFVKNNSYSEEIGTVDYETGKIDIKSFDFKINEGTQIQILAKPKNNNISVSENYVLSVKNRNILINGE